MRERRIQKVGKNTFTVSLPRKWIEKNGLEKQDSLFITENSYGDLVVSKAADRGVLDRPETVSLDEEFERNLLMIYLRGINELMVRKPPSSKDKVISAVERERILNLTKRMMGIEIFDENREYIVFKAISSYSEEDTRTILSRMFMMVQQLLKDLIAASSTKQMDEDALKSIIQRDSEIDRWYFLMIRQIRALLQNIVATRQIDKENPLQLMDFRMIGHAVEAIGDRAGEIANVLIEFKDEFKGFLQQRKELLVLSRKIFDVYQETRRAFESSDPPLANEIVKGWDGFVDEANVLEASLKDKVGESTPSILPLLKALWLLMDIYELLIDINSLIL
ncbi:MAG: PhoU domain-containing protein [Candidatus Hodarchaeota archaeon]